MDFHFNRMQKPTFPLHKCIKLNDCIEVFEKNSILVLLFVCSAVRPPVMSTLKTPLRIFNLTLKLPYFDRSQLDKVFT